MDKQTKNRMDKIFFWFEDNLFKNSMSYNRSLNLVFEFADWIDTDSGKDVIANEFGVDRLQEVLGEYDRGINKYLGDANEQRV